ncbi:MAG: Gfo/Idh/MocA family oxidoreductase, partial [Pseudonocardiaceae bacterium]
VGLGRSGRGLHLPVLSRARASHAAKNLFDNRPIVAVNPWGTQAELAGVVLVRSVERAAALTDPERTVVHLCSPPDTRVEVLGQLAELGFQKILVEKPLAVDEQDLAEIARLHRQWDLDLVVVAPWLASSLTHRIRQTLRGGELGALRSVFVIQRKPRFTRSLAGCGHPTAFDIEMPHSVGVALAIAGHATVCHARLTDMRFEDVVLPRLGSAWMSLNHESGVWTEIHSDLTSPTRERRIILKLEHGTMIGHYPNSEADHTAQLSTTHEASETRSVFHDDALSAFIVRTYQNFATAQQGTDDFTLNVEVVQLLSAAKRLCIPNRREVGLLPGRYEANGWGGRGH